MGPATKVNNVFPVYLFLASRVLGEIGKTALNVSANKKTSFISSHILEGYAVPQNP
jgi:hypothetical protein